MIVRMKDIADELGVSVVTVSKVFNNHRDISHATRERILKRMKELNYQPNLHAQGLVSGNSFMIGLIVPDLMHVFFAEIAKSLTSVIREKGFGLVISSSNEDPGLEQDEIAMMVRRRVDVLVLASCQEDPRNLRPIAKEVPLILLDRKFTGFEANFVGTNDVLVGQMATEHLVQMGYRRIAYIGGRSISTSLGRLRGYKKALSRHRIVVPETYIRNRKFSDESGNTTGREAMEKLLKVKPRPDAVFCYNDPAAIGAMNAIIAAKLRIPEDIGLIGAGNNLYGESLRIPLSTIDCSSNMLGQYAGNLALRLAAKNSRCIESIVVKPKLFARDSTREGPKAL